MPDYHYVDERELNEVGHSSTLFYDSLGRHVLTVSPEEFLTKTLFGTLSGSDSSVSFQPYLNLKLYGHLGATFQPSAWSSLSYDANDALLDSDYTATASTDVDINAFNNAKNFANTPFEHIEDSMGRTVQSEQLNVSENEKNTTFVLRHSNPQPIAPLITLRGASDAV